jgi:serine/threonine protein kinase
MQVILQACDSKYIILEKIGYGATCSVFKGYSTNDNSRKIYAIKIFKEQYKKYYEKEVSIKRNLPLKSFLALIKHGEGQIHQEQKNSSNIIPKPFDINISDKLNGKVFYEIEEIAENGELFNYVYELGKGFIEPICSKIFIKILKNVKLLHENNIIHGDIKPENILIGNDFDIKLIDFGFSQKINKKNNSIINSTERSDKYSSPEIRKANIAGYDGIKSDIFSLGVLLFVITVGRFPFNASSFSDKKYRLIMTKKYDLFWANFENYNLSSEFKNLINRLISYEPKERLSIDEILEHPWIKMNVKYNYINKNEFYIDEEVVKELKKRKEFMKKKAN